MITPFFHVGIIVPELGQAQRDMTSILGLTWEPIMKVELPVLVGERTVERRVTLVYSLEGPPYVELIEASEPPWAAQDGLHHLGIWSEDVAADIEALSSKGHVELGTGVVDGEGTKGGFSYLSGPTGVVLELVDVATQAAFDARRAPLLGQPALPPR
jgi:Glyoxalase/Bleomycin resistance protein/Dioxygenase superfamily